MGLILVGVGGAALFNFQFGAEKQSYEQTWTFETNDLKQLSIMTDDLPLRVNFVASEDGANSIRMAGKAKEDVVDQIKNAKLSDGVLKIQAKEGWTIGLMDFDFGSAQQVTVSLTEEAASALKMVQLHTDSGSIQVNGASADQGEIKSDSGSIKIYGFKGETLALKSDSGSIHGENLSAALSASSDSGSISIEHLNGTSNLNSDSGSIRLVKDDTSNATIKSDSGSVKVEVPASYGGFYDLKSDSGSIHAPDSEQQSTEVIKIRTDSGSIRVTQP